MNELKDGESLKKDVEERAAFGRPEDSRCACIGWPCDCPCHAKEMECVFGKNAPAVLEDVKLDAIISSG